MHGQLEWQIDRYDVFQFHRSVVYVLVEIVNVNFTLRSGVASKQCPVSVIRSTGIKSRLLRVRWTRQEVRRFPIYFSRHLGTVNDLRFERPTTFVAHKKPPQEHYQRADENQ